jgi:hypothetical protein
MNELDLLTRFRAEVPHGVSPHAEHLLRTGMLQNHSSQRHGFNPPRKPLLKHGVASRRPIWRFALVIPVAAGLAAAALLAAIPAGRPPAALTVKLLADRAAAAALSGPSVPAGQWIYRQVRYKSFDSGPHGDQHRAFTENLWFTAAGKEGYAGNEIVSMTFGLPAELSYARLSSLPADPAALERYLAGLDAGGAGAPSSPLARSGLVFDYITAMLWEYQLPPRLTAELYHALADTPGATVDPHATDAAGRPGVAFVLSGDGYWESELILSPSGYRFMGLSSAIDNSAPGGTNSQSAFAILRTAFVTRPGDVP